MCVGSCLSLTAALTACVHLKAGTGDVQPEKPEDVLPPNAGVLVDVPPRKK